MMRLFLTFLLAATAVLAAEGPRFGEIFEILREELPDADLEEAALQGILASLDGQARIVPASPQSADIPPPLSRFYESSIGYIAAPILESSSSRLIDEAYNRLDSTHVLRGLVLDLRHVSGENYAEVVDIASLFTSDAVPLLDWGEGTRSSAPGEHRIEIPLVVIIDGTTRGAPEALAAVIRSARLGILVGQPTAGQARSWRSFSLESGHVLQVAAGPVRIDGGVVLQGQGVRPDITADAAGTGEPEASEEPAPEDGALPLPHDDPLLARALELLKGIGIVEERNRL